MKYRYEAGYYKNAILFQKMMQRHFNAGWSISPGSQHTHDVAGHDTFFHSCVLQKREWFWTILLAMPVAAPLIGWGLHTFFGVPK